MDRNSPADSPRISPWPPLLAGAFFLILYLWSTAPGIVEFFDDSLEFQLVLPTLGIAHPTGYPLYTLLGALWSRALLPVGEWAWRVNALSAVCAAMAVALVAATAQRLAIVREVGDSRRAGGRLARIAGSLAWPAIAAAVAFGLGPTWSGMATVAEVYALHNLIVAAALWMSLRAVAAPAHSRRRWLIALAFVIGLGLAHHRTTVLLIPALAIYLLWSLPELRRPSTLWLWMVVAALAPLLLYLYIPLRAAMGVHDLNVAYVNTVQGFLDHVLARRYTAFFGANDLAVQRSMRDWLALAVSQTGWIALALAAAGFVGGLMPRGARQRGASWRGARRPEWTLIGVALATNLAFAWFYHVGDVEVFLLPVWLCVAIAAGGGVAWVQGALARWPALAVAASVALIVLLAGGWDGRAEFVHRREEWRAQDAALAMVATDFPSQSTVVGIEGEMTAIRYMQAAHDKAQGVQTVVADDEAMRRERLAQALGEGRAAYLTRTLPGIAGQYSFGGDGGLVRVWPRGEMESRTPAHALDEGFADGALLLRGYDLSPLSGAEGRTNLLTLYWEPTQVLTQTLKVSLRLLGDDGAPMEIDGTPWQQDAFPVQGVAPTTTWLPGEVVSDVYLLPAVDEGAIELIVYDADTVEEAGRGQVPATP